MDARMLRINEQLDCLPDRLLDAISVIIDEISAEYWHDPERCIKCGQQALPSWLKDGFCQTCYGGIFGESTDTAL